MYIYKNQSHRHYLMFSQLVNFCLFTRLLFQIYSFLSILPSFLRCFFQTIIPYMKSYIQIRKYIILIMNKILITNSQQPHSDETTYALSYSTANKMLPILRSDHFNRIQLDNPHTIDIKILKFLVQLTRLLKTDGEVVINGEESQQISTLLKTLHLFQTETSNTSTVFLKTQPQVKEQEKTQKLAIGFQSNEVEEQIDETELLQGQNLEIKKPKVENCDIKPKACANCNCGRKDKEQAPVSKQELVKSINEGKQVSGCGKCFLGDSFRCGTCPYKGLPAFKIGDKLKLVEQGGVIVEQSSTFVSASGKIKLQI